VILFVNTQAVENSTAFFIAEMIILKYATAAMFILRPSGAIGTCAWTLSVPGMLFQCFSLL
ncbi:MAG: hypothetical protein ABIS69_07235, partial [Sediminibacterium sp.]